MTYVNGPFAETVDCTARLKVDTSMVMRFLSARPHVSLAEFSGAAHLTFAATVLDTRPDFGEIVRLPGWLA